MKKTKRKMILSALAIITAGSIFFVTKPASAVGIVLDFDELKIIYRDRPERHSPPPPPPPPAPPAPRREPRGPRGYEVRDWGPAPHREPGMPRGPEGMRPQPGRPGGPERMPGGPMREPGRGPRPPR